jgi:hypothetical protein
MIALHFKDKLRETIQVLQSIFKDELRSKKAAYMIHQPSVPSEDDLARLTRTADPAGIQKMHLQGVWNSANQAYLKKMDRQEQNKIMVYTI